MQIGIESGHIIITLGALLFFGILYANLINWLNRRGYSEGYTAFLVTGGVLITLLASITTHHEDPIIDFLLELACFAASGIPMIINDAYHYVLARQKEQRQIAQGFNHDQTP